MVAGRISAMLSRPSSNSQTHRRGQPGGGHRRRYDRARDGRAGFGRPGPQVDLAVDVELVPVDGVTVVARGGQGGLAELVGGAAGRHRGGVLEAGRLPAGGLRIGVVEQRGEPGQPGRRGLAHLGHIAGRNRGVEPRYVAFCRARPAAACRRRCGRRAAGRTLRWRGRASPAAPRWGSTARSTSYVGPMVRDVA